MDFLITWEIANVICFCYEKLHTLFLAWVIILNTFLSFVV